MKSRFADWKGWNAVICTQGPYEMVIGISAGPRILSFGYAGGRNFLYEDHTDFGVGEWRMYGGHRFTIAPESDRSYEPDNEPCEVAVRESAVLVWARRRDDGTKLSITVSPSEQGFDILHTLENSGALAWEGALWAITCVPRSDFFDGSCATSEVHFWPGTDPSDWQQANGRLTVAPGVFRGKAGWHSVAPSLAVVRQQHVFRITHPDPSVAGNCVDHGSNTEIFVCADYAELETLSEKMTVAPGQSASHRQCWRLLQEQTDY